MELMDNRPQKIADLTAKYQSVMRELTQLRALPSAFPCDRLVGKLTKKGARLRIQLQQLSDTALRIDGVNDR